MKVRKLIAGMTAATALSLGAVATPADAAPPQQARSSQQAGAVAGLIAAVVQANLQNIDATVVEVGDVDVNVDLQNVLNNNRVLTNFLNNNDINVEDVVDIVVEGNDIIVSVLSGPNVQL